MPKEFEGLKPIEETIGREISPGESPKEVSENLSEENKERKPGDPFDRKEMDFADDVLNYIGEAGNVLNYITDATSRESVRSLMKEYSGLEPNNPDTPKKKNQIADEIYRIADEAYDKK